MSWDLFRPIYSCIVKAVCFNFIFLKGGGGGGGNKVFFMELIFH